MQMDIEQIKNLLPHRYPFLLVDRIIEISEGRIVGLKNVTANEPFFQGHFPEKAVMPGVLLVEAMAQTGAILALSKPENKGKLVYLIAVNEARFRKPVVPGDQLKIVVDVTRVKSKVGVIKCSVTVDGEEASSAEIMYSVVDKNG